MASGRSTSLHVPVSSFKMLRSPSNPTTNPAAAFSWSKDMIKEYLLHVERKPADFCTNPTYLNAMAPSQGGKPPRHELQTAASFILTLAWNVTSNETSNKDVPLSYSPSLPSIGLAFQGANLPINTMFDALGWLLSVTSVPPQTESLDRTYYLPLVSLFARWCRVLMGDVKLAPPMVHVAWFRDAQGRTAVLLGSTIGKVPAPLKIVNVIRERQRELERLGLVAARPGQVAQTKGNTLARGGQQYVVVLGEAVDGKFVPSMGESYGTADEIEKGFGQCAETFFYLVALTVGGAIANQETVRGFALKPDMPGFGESDSYIPINAANALRDPCLESCQRLITQIGVINQQPWNWETSFGVRSIRNQVSPGSGGEPAPPNRAARRAAAAAAAAANSLPAA